MSEKITLTYFDAPVSRGEECRLALFLANVPFTDDRLKPGEFPKRKASTPYGAVPVLTAEGHPAIAQSNAILRLIGSMHGLHPSEPWEAARHEALMGAIEDMRGRLTATRHEDRELPLPRKPARSSPRAISWSGPVTSSRRLRRAVRPGVRTSRSRTSSSSS